MAKFRRAASSGIMFALLVGSMFFSAITSVKGDAGTHDLGVKLSDTLIAHYHLSSGKSDNITATVKNNGNVTEQNVTVMLLINGTLYLQVMAQKLLPNATFSVLYPNWSPDDGVWNLTVYAPQLSDEPNTTNNVDQKLVNVCPNAPPIASFNYSPQPPIMNENVDFDASNSTDSDWGNITTYSWSFGGTTMNTSVPIVTQTFPAYGNLTVGLTLYDTEGENSSTSTNVSVVARPVANFGIDELRYFVNKSLTFNATASYDPDNRSVFNKGISTYAWDFGDGNNNITSNPLISHTYVAQGFYNITLNVTDSDDRLISHNYSMLKVGVDSRNPIANFTVSPHPSYVLNPLTFNATASYDPDQIQNMSAPNKGIALFTWDFGNNETSSISNPTVNYTYQKPGTYNVTLMVTDSDESLTNSTNMTITVSLEVLLKAVDSATGNTTIIHNPGETFTVNITVTNVENLTSFYFKLSWPPNWMPIYADLFDPESVTVFYGGFLGPQKFPNGTPGRVIWTLDINHRDEGYITANATLSVDEPRSGNGTLASVQFKVATSGNCTLQLSETKLSKSFESMNPIDNVVMNGSFYTTTPVANFTYSHYPAVNERTSFDASASYDPDNSTALNNGIATYAWDFGDGNVNVTSSPFTNYTYVNEGNYSVTLNVTDYDGNAWNFTQTVTVHTLIIHDVGITDIDPPQFMLNTTLGVYETSGKLPIRITVMNNGTYPEETCNVTVYAENATNKIDIGTQTVIFSTINVSYNFEFQWCLLAFKWNVSGLSMGDYNISAVVTGVESDPSLGDNSVEGGTVRVYLTGDVSGNRSGVRDNMTNMRDIQYLILLFNTTPTSSNWTVDADLNGDGRVNMRDINIVIQYFNIKAP